MKKRAPLSSASVSDLVVTTAKYAAIDRALVDAIAANETLKANDEGDAVKRVKRKLHQLVGAYLDARMPFDVWLEALRTAPDDMARLAIAQDIMTHHASTKERLPEMGAFYAALFADLPVPRTVVDLACGMNPLARPLMPLPASVRYRAFDVHRPLVDFLGEALTALGYPAEVGVHDLLTGPPDVAADVALVLKTFACLEQADKSAPRRLVDGIQAPVIIVSFPTVSLGGARRGMEGFYERHFRLLGLERRFDVETLRFNSELVFRLRRR